MFRLVLVFSTLFSPNLWAISDEPVVIEVRKKIKLHNSEVVYPDYFINGGSKMGLDKGAVVSIIRRVPVHDPFQNASIGDFRIKIAEVEIVHADPEKAIARLIEIDRRADRPMVEYDAVMVGDRLDLSSLRQKVSQVEPFLMPTPSPEVAPPAARQPASAPQALPAAVPLAVPQRQQL